MTRSTFFLLCLLSISIFLLGVIGGSVIATVTLTPEYKVNLYRFIAQKVSLDYIHYKFNRIVLSIPAPISYIDNDKLTKKVAQPAPWVIQQFNNDFAKYADFSKTAVRSTYAAFAADNLLVHYTIKDGKLFQQIKDTSVDDSTSQAFKTFHLLFSYIAQQGYVKDLDFIVRLRDFCSSVPENQGIKSFAPILTVVKDLSKAIEKDFVLIPDWMILESWYKLRPSMQAANKYYKWEAKENKIFWRGGEADLSGYRHKVVAYSANGKGNYLLDAKFVVTKSDWILPENHLKYKFQLTMDGHTAAWERPVWQLYSNSVMLKQQSPLIQWYDLAIKDGVHYVEVDNNPEHLLAAINQYSDEQLQTIANNATQFIEDSLSFHDMVAYIILGLQKYEKLQHNVLD